MCPNFGVRSSSLRQLIPFLRNELDWPIDQDASLEEVTYEYDTEELGIDAKYAGAISEIRQLRPLANHQPWGIFWVSFKKKALPVVVLRKILASLVEKKRAASSASERASWKEDDLLFISAYGLEDQRELAIAHFEDAKDGTKPSLKVLQWDASDTTMKLERVLQDMQEKLRWHEEYQSDPERWRQEWASAFRTRIGHVIRTSDKLADALAGLARRIRDRAIEAMKSESARGPLKKMLKAFQESLIHDLDEAGFADTYAQTVTYGLLTAAFSRTEMSEGRHGTAFEAEDITHMVPVTNPFLKEMLGAFLIMGGRKGKIDFDELGIGEVVDLLRGDETDLPAIMADFGNKTRGEDPVIHFYEHFLAAYNKELKVQRGVFYTPQPVVSYIVRSVHELLQTEFGLEDGLASTVTWGEMLEKLPDLKLPTYTDEKGKEVPVSKNEPFVLILDPATGTATFIVEVIDLIYEHLTEKWKQARMSDAQRAAAWNEYVPKHLLPRLFAYELMMAPYAIAHMKVGLKLAEKGYQFGSDERVRIYLTNALEPAQQQLRLPDFEPLAHEAEAVNRVKREKRFTVVIGNPPYSHMTANPGMELKGIVDIYRGIDGEVIREKGAIMFERTIQDDYVKFHAFADRLTTKLPAIRALITNSAYIDNPTLRGMRCYLSHAWDKTWLLDLNGDVKRSTGGDENVFDIRTGVAISVLLRTANVASKTHSFFSDLSGPRSQKTAFLDSKNLQTTDWINIKPQSPYYRFRPQLGGEVPELQDAPLIHDIFILKSEAIKTNRDHFVIGDSDDEILRRIRTFIDPLKDTATVKEALTLNDNAQWTVDIGRKDCRTTFAKSHLADISYRPFDNKRIYYHPSVVFSPRPVLGDNVLGRENLVFLTSRRIRTENHAHFFVCDKIAVKEMLSSADNCNSYPLYRYERNLSQERRLSNFTPEFLKEFASRLGLPQLGDFGLPSNISPEDILHYAYAVFHSPGYRKRYAEFLKIDFPRLPLTESLELFKGLARLGSEIVSLHLLVSKFLEKPRTTFIGAKSHEVQKASFKNDTVFIDKAQTTGFKGVPENVWSFHIGGYQVCEKWLKDRKGRTLSDEDIAHYHKIVISLQETIRLMAEIDQVIEKHGGWPGAFATTKAPGETPDQPTPATPKAKAKSKSSGQHADLGLHLEGELPL